MEYLIIILQKLKVMDTDVLNQQITFVIKHQAI
jgi:hypothetical protein